MLRNAFRGKPVGSLYPRSSGIKAEGNKARFAHSVECGEGFYHNIADNDPAEFERACIDRPKDETLPDQWTSQIFARILAHHPVIMVTDLCDHQMLKDMHMTPVNTLEEALKLAIEMKGADAKVAVIPDGLGVVVAQH